MYGHSTFDANNSQLSYDSDVINNKWSLAAAAPAQLIIPDPVVAAVAGIEPAGDGSGCSGYGSPTTSIASGSCCGIIQKSTSNNSLQKNGYHCHLASDFVEIMADGSSPVRRVFSTGDLQQSMVQVQGHMEESPLSSESSMIIESMSKACKYGPEEKKERIERYRSKRRQRNFNKKITYTCRKKLADSRPRIRGRFARNDEIERSPQLVWGNLSGEEEHDQQPDENWVSFLDDHARSPSPSPSPNPHVP